MYITLSVATSADLYIDDMTPTRLVLSSEEDWAQVYRLRASHDAILVGGETLRRDNPSLGAKGEGQDPVRVVISGEGEISLSAKIFHRAGGGVIIFSKRARPELEGLAEVVVLDAIDVAGVVTQLEKRGISSLLVEGGAKTLELFLASGEVDKLRVATNRSVVVGDHTAPRFDPSGWVEGVVPHTEMLGGVEVSTYHFESGRRVTPQDRELMRRAIEVSRFSPPKESCYRVGAVVETLSGEVFEGYTLETAPTHHAEQAAIYKALDAGADLRGATIYASMEPCSIRSSEPESCSDLIMRYGFRRVLFAIYEPSHFVECRGAENLRRSGVEVVYFEEFSQQVREVNAHILGE